MAARPRVEYRDLQTERHAMTTKQTAGRAVTLLGLGCVLATSIATTGHVMADNHTVADVQRSTGKPARQRLLPYFADAKTEYPPRQITLLAVRQAATLELWTGPDTNPKFIRHYSIEQGSAVTDDSAATADGIYEVKRLHPDADGSLAIELISAHQTDQEPPASIYIHKSNDDAERPTGSLGIAAEANEELFVLAADVGKRSIKVLVAADDPRLLTDETAKTDSGNTDVVNELFSNFRQSPP